MATTVPYVAILTGGLSLERDVSVASAHRIADELKNLEYDVMIHDVDASLVARLSEHRPDVAIIALHGAAGEDGTLRAVLDLLDIPYLGADAAASQLAWHKPTAKSIWRRAGLPTPAWMTVPRHRLAELGAPNITRLLARNFALPLIVKPARGSSGLGIQAVNGADQLPAALMTAFAYDDIALVEQLIDGTDVAVSIVGDDALPPVEIEPLGGEYDYQARYSTGHTTWHAPARFDTATTAALTELAMQAHHKLGLRQLSRIDMVVTTSGGPYLLEANVAPGMTETSLLPLAAAAAGSSLSAVLDPLLRELAGART